MRGQQGAMQFLGHPVIYVFVIGEARLIRFNEPLLGRTGVEEDHADDILGPALRV